MTTQGQPAQSAGPHSLFQCAERLQADEEKACGGMRAQVTSRGEAGVGVDVSEAGNRCVRSRNRCVRRLTCLGEKGLDFRNGGLRLYLKENSVSVLREPDPGEGGGVCQVQAGQDQAG